VGRKGRREIGVEGRLGVGIHMCVLQIWSEVRVIPQLIKQRDDSRKNQLSIIPLQLQDRVSAQDTSTIKNSAIVTLRKELQGV
jgi:hypothetical protein